MSQPRHFRIFLSSPSDVPQERDDAQAAVHEINDTGEFSNHFDLKLLRWDDPKVVLPMPVTDIPQKSVNIYMTKPSECDLVVVLFWTRMGSPLVMDEREYLSGTHYEYSEALEGYQQNGIPSVWLYRCVEEPLVSQKDPKRDEKNQQFDRVEEFFKQFLDIDGRLTNGVNEYVVHSDFKDLFKKQLLTYLRHLRDKTLSIQIQPLAPTKPAFSGIPYRGLNALTEDDSAILFGRDAEVLEVLSRVDNRRLVAVLGSSGSGKSSLVAAGVIPRLRERGWRIVRCMPTDDPFFSLARAIVSQLPELGVKPTEFLAEARKLAAILCDKPEHLVHQLEATLQHKRILVFIDQFEEIFTLADKNPVLKSSDRDIVVTFLQALQFPSRQVTVLLTMRADFYGLALPYLDVLERDTYGLRPASIFALIEIIKRPADLAGLTLDIGLAQHIVEEVGDEAGALALIAYLMEALYRMMQERGDTHLTHADYEMVGGVRGAIDTLANRAYADLPFEDTLKEDALRRVFRELIAFTEGDDELIPTRQRAELTKFEALSSERLLIGAFTNARLLVTDGYAVEVAHEAILRYWDKLAIWINAVKGDLVLVRQYEHDAKAWLRHDKLSPLPHHEALVHLYKAFERLNLLWYQLPEPLKSYTEPEASRLLRELTIPSTSHSRRVAIGDRLAEVGDPRPGVGLKSNGFPDIEWCSVREGGIISIRNHRWEYRKDHERENINEFYNFRVEPFYVAKYLITNAQFEAFFDAPNGFRDKTWWLDVPLAHQVGDYPDSEIIETSNYPCCSINWYQAIAFTRWLNHLNLGSIVPNPAGPKFPPFVVGQNAEIRLPTLQEWKWAAQNGDEHRKYPWGELDDEARANTAEQTPYNRPLAVGMYPNGIAHCGALDMIGNLHEWCLNEAWNWQNIGIIGTRDGLNIMNDMYLTPRIVCGGAFNSWLADVSGDQYDQESPTFDQLFDALGFRVVLALKL